MPELTEEQRRELAELSEHRATHAPWAQKNSGLHVYAADENGQPRGGMRVGMYPHVAGCARVDDAALIVAARNALPELLRGYEEYVRLREVLRWTHATYCTEDYTARGRHAPECLLYAIEE